MNGGDPFASVFARVFEGRFGDAAARSFGDDLDRHDDVRGDLVFDACV